MALRKINERKVGKGERNPNQLSLFSGRASKKNNVVSLAYFSEKRKDSSTEEFIDVVSLHADSLPWMK